MRRWVNGATQERNRHLSVTNKSSMTLVFLIKALSNTWYNIGRLFVDSNFAEIIKLLFWILNKFWPHFNYILKLFFLEIAKKPRSDAFKDCETIFGGHRIDTNLHFNFMVMMMCDCEDDRTCRKTFLVFSRINLSHHFDLHRAQKVHAILKIMTLFIWHNLTQASVPAAAIVCVMKNYSTHLSSLPFIHSIPLRCSFGTLFGVHNKRFIRLCK